MELGLGLGWQEILIRNKNSAQGVLIPWAAHIRTR